MSFVFCHPTDVADHVDPLLSDYLRISNSVVQIFPLSLSRRRSFTPYLDDSLLVKHFPALLKALKKRIASLPAALPLGDEESALARYLGNLEIDEEGATFSANRQWERAFQVPEEEQRKRLLRGKYGLDLVCPFLEFFAMQEGIQGTDSVGMLARRIHQLNKLLDSM